MNSLLRKCSDDLIDLIEQMLNKDSGKRISMLEIFDHPWIRKYNRRNYSDHSSSRQSETCSEHDDLVELEQEMLDRLTMNIEEADAAEINT